MSLSFPSRRVKYENFDIEDRQYKELHWTKQLEIRPLGSRTRKTYEQGDFDNRLDNWDDPEGEQHEPQLTDTN